VAALAAVLCAPTVLAGASDPAGATAGAVTAVPTGAVTAVPAGAVHAMHTGPQPTPAAAVASDAVVTVEHARECASVRRAGAVTVVVPVVVDMGGPSDEAEVSCVSVPAGSTDAQVLSARAKLLGLPSPRYAVSGLLCGIDGYPATGCGQQNGSHYAYWAYFHGGSSWTYASEGPASWTVSAGDVEGWRFEPEGSATPADPPPRSPSGAQTLCPASVPPTTTTTTPSSTAPSTSPPTTTATATGASGGQGGSGASPSSVNPSGPAPSVAGTGATGPTAARGARPDPGVGTTTSVPPPSPAPPGRSASPVRHQTPPSRLAVRRTPTNGGAPIGLIIAVVLIAALAAGAAFRARRRTAAQ